MLRKCFALTLVALDLAFQGLGAGFSGSDDFNDNSKNVALWGPDVTLGAGLLDETSSRLVYTSSSPVVSQSARPWILNYGTFSTSWDVRMDVFNSHVAGAGSGGISSFGLEVFNRADDGDSAYTEIYAVEAGKGFFSVLRSDANDIGCNETGDIGAFSGTVRMAYDSSTHVISSFYDPDGALNGYAWTPLSTFGINGSGGGANANWGMGANDEFLLTVYGYSENVAISSGLLSADNFVVIPEPSVGALLVGALMTFSGYCLFQRRTARTS